MFKGNSKVVFSIKNFVSEYFVKTKKGNSTSFTQLTFHLKTNIVKIELETEKADWLTKIIGEYSIENARKTTLAELKNSFEMEFEDFELFWFSKPIQKLKQNGIILQL